MNELSKTYDIKDGYKINPNPVSMTISDMDIESVYTRYQHFVYEITADVIRARPLKTSVLDIGCGYPYKLAKFVRPLTSDITGVDGRQPVEFSQTNFRFGRWVEGDLSDPSFSLDRMFDVIVCADVIEHMDDPDMLLEIIRRHSNNSSTIIISTPERDNIRGLDHFGPPPNPTHVREWNQNELVGYLKKQGFKVDTTHVVSDVDDADENKNCLICICSLEV